MAKPSHRCWTIIKINKYAKFDPNIPLGSRDMKIFNYCEGKDRLIDERMDSHSDYSEDRRVVQYFGF